MPVLPGSAPSVAGSWLARWSGRRGAGRWHSGMSNIVTGGSAGPAVRGKWPPLAAPHSWVRAKGPGESGVRAKGSTGQKYPPAPAGACVGEDTTYAHLVYPTCFRSSSKTSRTDLSYSTCWHLLGGGTGLTALVWAAQSTAGLLRLF